MTQIPQPPEDLIVPETENPKQESRVSVTADIYQLINQTIPQINQADSIEQALDLAGVVFDHAPFKTIQLIPADGILKPFRLHPVNAAESATQNLLEYGIALDRLERSLSISSPYIFNKTGEATLPVEMINLLHGLGLRSAAFIPVWRSGILYTLYLIGDTTEDGLDPSKIQPYVSLAGQITTAIDKLLVLEHLQRRVAGLQSLASISQAISVVTELDELYELIHEKISQVMGEIDLAIALYEPQTDMISIPYAHEANQKLSLPPFPLGEGLTSILIRSQQPLLLVEDTERRALELGAKISGASAKSWMGVPLIVSGEVLGAIIVQDTQHEHRFDDDDLRLMTTLAAQVAITIRNLRLLADAKQRAERERMLSEINRQIWAAPDAETIARTALQELGRVLRISHGIIRLYSPASAFTSSDDEQQGLVLVDKSLE